MKRYDDIIKALLLLVTGWFFVLQTKAEEPDTVAYMDSVEFTLITCSPHEEIYSLYGHSALGVHDLHQGREEDVAFNWGIFNYQKPFFVLRFVFGLTDYELGLSEYHAFCNYYKHWRSSVTEQTLNLTEGELSAPEPRLPLQLLLRQLLNTPPRHHRTLCRWHRGVRRAQGLQSIVP